MREEGEQERVTLGEPVIEQITVNGTGRRIK